MNWEVCIICGQGGGDLKCPADSLQRNGYTVYSNFLHTVQQFRKPGSMPVQLELHDASTDLFLEDRAKWHKLCHFKFAPSKVMKAEK